MKVSTDGGGCSVEMAPLGPLVHALFAAALALPAAASAEPCAIEMTGADSAEWVAASESLAELALTERDCLRVHIEIAAGQARVRFITGDGRSAERSIHTPSELRPTIDALRVQAPAAAEPAPSKPPAPAPITTTPSQPAKTSPARANASDVRVALLLGVRGDDVLAGPLLMGDLSLGSGLFEFGGSLSAEVQYGGVTDVRSPERQGSAAAFSVHGGVRAPAGSFDLRTGGRVTFAPLLTVNHDVQACPPGMTCPFQNVDDRTSEWRFGAYAGFAVPRSALFRFRAELGADVVAPAPADGDLALTPAAALFGLVGLEVAP
jgi:hypothetical protein